jgi:hypothetical protein
MFSIASTLRFAAAGLALAAAASLPSVARADGPRLPKPAPRVRIPGQDRIPLQLPDLVVDTPGYGVRSGLVEAGLWVRNVGTGNAGAFVVDWRFSVIRAGDDLPTGRISSTRSSLAGLSAGGGQGFNFAGVAARRGDTILIEGTVDATTRVGESNERNNRFSIRIPVR